MSSDVRQWAAPIEILAEIRWNRIARRAGEEAGEEQAVPGPTDRWHQVGGRGTPIKDTDVVPSAASTSKYSSCRDLTIILTRDGLRLVTETIC